jgi:hypothetical protein
MRFDLHLRTELREQIATVAEKMREWEDAPRFGTKDRFNTSEAVQFFKHTTYCENLLIAGIDGSGDYPAVTYSDSFVHLTVAHGTIYKSDISTGLRELPPFGPPLVQVTWMAEEETQRLKAWDNDFTALAGLSIAEVIDRSDYRDLKTEASGKNTTLPKLATELVRPHAADSGNIAIQLRTLGELGSALRLLKSQPGLDYLLYDGTFSLPLVTRKDVSLFYEHLKRLCCVEAKSRGVAFMALSKSHGLPGMDLLEEIAKEKVGTPVREKAEHWFLRLPVPGFDDWKFPLAEGRQLPPIGAVTYLVRFHRNVPVLRLDMDLEYWRAHIYRDNQEETQYNECQVFQKLDYACHDQRCFGYPYPIKAGHDRASLTAAERVTLRKQIVDAAVDAGLRRSLFRDVSMATGHQ